MAEVTPEELQKMVREQAIYEDWSRALAEIYRECQEDIKRVHERRKLQSDDLWQCLADRYPEWPEIHAKISLENLRKQDG